MTTALRPCVLAFLGAAVSAQTVLPPYNVLYSLNSLGSVPGVPPSYGGLTFLASDPSFLLIGGSANSVTGQIFKIRVARDPQGHVTGFVGTASVHCAAQYLDGGVAYGPDRVLFVTQYPFNQLMQVKYGSVAPDKVVDLNALGVGASVGSVQVVPAGFPGAGLVKFTSYDAGNVYSGVLLPDGSGTFDVLAVTATAGVGGGPEGLVYVPEGSPLFPNLATVLISEYNTGTVVAWQIGANGDPLPGTRSPFVGSVAGAEGAAIDPITGDFLLSTFGGGNQVLAVRGFASPCRSFGNYGTGLQGAGGRVPTLTGRGCAAIGFTVHLDIADGVGGAPGILLLGSAQASIPVLGGTLLLFPVRFTIAHALGGAAGVPGAGTFTLPLSVPYDIQLAGVDLFFQSFEFDQAAVQSFSHTPGLALRIR